MVHRTEANVKRQLQSGPLFQLGGAIFPSFRRKPESRACGHIAMPLQPSFRRKPESSVVISYYGNGAGKPRFRLAPE